MCKSQFLSTLDALDAFIYKTVCADTVGVLYNYDVLFDWLRPIWSDIPSYQIHGSLRRSFDEWVKIGAHPFILDIIKNGYSIPFSSPPPSFSRRDNASA